MTTTRKPDLIAYRESLRLPIHQLVQELTDMLRRKLTAYIGNVKDVRAVDRWVAAGTLYEDAERLRLAYHVARMLNDYDSAAVVQAWMTGINPELEDKAPLRLLRDGKPEDVAPEILRDACTFIAGS